MLLIPVIRKGKIQTPEVAEKFATGFSCWRFHSSFFFKSTQKVFRVQTRELSQITWALLAKTCQLFLYKNCTTTFAPDVRNSISARLKLGCLQIRLTWEIWICWARLRRGMGWGLTFPFECLMHVSMFLVHVASSLRSAYRQRTTGELCSFKTSWQLRMWTLWKLCDQACIYLS